MYGVSDAYKTAMHQAVQRFRLTGTVGTTEFTDENILSGSFSITNQCSGNNEIQIGQVYVGELNVTFPNLPLTRYSLKGMQITPSFGLRLADGTYEDVPLGVFNISEASWTMSGLVVKAYDNMSLLDKNCNTSQSNGTAYEMALLATEACGLTLGTTEAEFKTFANGTETLSLYAESDIETWRDFISWLAQTIGCNAMAGRDGSIIFRPYGQTVVDTLDEEHRFEGASFSDFETRYTGLSCVNLADQTTKYYHVENDDALVYNLGTNPFMQYGVDETKDALRANVLTALQQIDYVPFKATLVGNPAYDLMDVFSFSGGIADADKLFCMTKYNFKYNGGYEMEGVGENPALASAKSKTDKNISGLLAQVEQGKLGITTFTNASAYDLGETAVKVISIRFVTSEANHMLFFAQIVVDVKADAVSRSADAAGTIVVPIPVVSSGSSTSGDSAGADTSTETGTVDSGSDSSGASSSEGSDTGTDRGNTTETTTDVSVEVNLPVSWSEDGQAVCYVTFELNDTKIEIHHPVETWHSGKHTFLLYYPIEDVTANYTNIFSVYLRMSGGTGNIEIGGIVASISGQAMAAQEAWDGRLEFGESVRYFDIGRNSLKAVGYSVMMEKRMKELVQRSYADTMTGRTAIGAFCKPADI
ncbi:hypothetical protein SAMN02745687_01261 [Lachnospiraceae bacterium NK3A20]|nr:hypothetical protein SAMN02745687_01261 [Lachnospiraceae bacterium NK3A20]